MTRHSSLLSLSLAGLCAGLPAQLPWQRSLDAALQAASERQQVLLIAVLIPGERDSDALVETYRDAGVRKLGRACVCLRIDVQSERGDEDRLTVLEKYLDAPPREPFLAPHHVIVNPDGETVISSAARRMTVGQMEWFLADGIKKFDGSFKWPRNDRMRAPEGLRYKEREGSRDELRLPPTKKEVKAAIDALKRG